MNKKILVLLALLVALTLVFVACQNDPKPDDTTADQVTTEEPTQNVEDPTAAPSDDETTEAEDPTDVPTDDVTTAPEDPTDKPEDPTDKPVDDVTTPEPETDDPMEPVNVFDAEDIQTVTGGDPSNMTQDCLTLEDGYIHVVPIGPDPYWYPFAGVDGARYVAIRYRTDATGADMQLYMSSTGTGPQDDTTMIRQPVIADGEWHVIIFDTQSLIDANLYDGEYVSYFRFDPLEAGYKLDENGQPYKETLPDGSEGPWARYSLPEGCMIDIAYIGFFHCEEAVAKYDFEQYPPYAQPGEAGLKNVSFDTFYVNNQMYFPEDGGADAKLDAINNILTFNAASELESIILRGWIGFDQPIDTFGYYVDNYEFVYGDYKKPTEDGVLGAGGEHATRFEIFVDLSYLEGDDHFVGFVVKLADGTIVQLREDITIDLPELPKDITDSFTSDVNSNEVGTTVDASDLANFFMTELPTGGCAVEANGEGKLYHMTSINDMYADVNGRYFFKANVVDSNGAGWMFVRGYKVVNSDEIIEKFDPANNFYKINNYYETDMAGAMGGAGIYARLGGGKLFIMVKHYNPENVTRVGNKIYAIDAVGTELTLADNGSTVSVLVDGVTYATIDLTGSKAYEDINEVDPAGEFAATAVITLKDGTTETIENTLIAATCEAQIGIVARAGSFKFDALAVGGYSAIEVPALEIVTPEEPEPVDPDAPVLVLDPEFINNQAGSTQQTVAQHIGSHEIITEDGVTFVRLTSNGGDPYVALVNLGSYLELPPYMAFAYRTNCDLDAHVFIGSGSGWNGNGDVANVAWNQDNNWNLAVLDLNNAGLTSIQGGIISYCRFDFFTGNGAGNMDVEYVAFFNTAEAAEKYFNNLHGIEIPTEPEVTDPQEPETTEPQEPETTEPQEPETTEPQEPETEEPKPEVAYKNETITLAERAGGGPFGSTKTFGQRYNIGDALLKAITVENMATYDDGDVNTWSLKIWQWNTDYATTVAAEPLFVKLGENHKNNTHFSIFIEGVEIKGDFYYEVEYLTGSKQFTGWTANGTVIEGLQTYAGGQLKDNHYAASIIIGVPYDPNAPVADITNKFESNVGANAEGTDIRDSDLKNYFTIVYGAADPHKVAGGMYQFGGINEMFAKADGLYAFSANIQGAVIMQDTLFVRGYHAVNFPQNPALLVNNYYEDDGNGSTGGAGIYVTISNDVLYIVVKAFNPANSKGIQNHVYQMPANGGTNVTIADDGKVVYVILEGKLAATIALSGETTYNEIVLPLDPGCGFAKTAVVTLADGTTATIENTLVASNYISQFGVVARGGQINFWSLSVKGFSEIEIPQFPHIHSYESSVTPPTCTEDGYTTHTCACGDSYTDTVVPATGHNFVDGVCGICGEADPDYVAPETHKMPAEFILSLYQANLGKTLYFKGAMSGYYFATSESITDAVKLYSEEVEGGYRMYFMDGETKTYLDIVYRDINKANVVLTTTPVGVYVWNEEANTWTVTIPEAESTFYLGTYNSYNTISASGVYYITGDNAANVGVSQFLAQWADVPAAHEHNYTPVVTDPTCTEDGYTTYTCECGHSYTDDVVPAPGHNFVDGFCGICGEADPDVETPDEPDAPVAGGAADFNTIVTPNANGDSSYKNTYTTENGWVSENSAIQAGGTNNINPQFTVIGPDNSYKAICMNGKVGFAGKITSPTLTGGISKLTINYTKMFTDTDLSVTITITDLATGTAYTATLAKQAPKDEKYTVWTYEWVLETPITGDFTIELVNDCPSNNSSSNKDRITILGITWEGAAAEEPETPDEPTANEINVTTTDNYTWIDVVEFTATVSGTYTFTLPAGLGAFDVTACDTWPPVPGTAPYVDYYDNAEGATFSIDLAAGETTRFYVGALTKADWVITWTVVEGEVGGGDEPTPEEPVVEDVVLSVGDNEINVTEDMKAEGGFNATITVDVDGDYKFSSNYLLVRVYNGMGMMLGTGSAYLTAGTYNLEIVTAFAPGAGVYGINVEMLAPVEPEPDEPEQPSGNPVIETLPFTYEITTGGENTFDVYYDFTAAADVTLVISRPAGGLVSLSGNSNDWSTDENGNYNLFVPAGETVCLNFWTMSPTTVGSFTVSEQAPAHKHEYTSNVTAPTCQAGGYTTYTCACGDSYTDDETAKVGHVFYAGVCTYCNGALPTYTKWDADKAVVKHLSFDQLYTVSATEGNIFPMGKEAEWNKVAVIDNTVPQLYFWGWIGYVGGFGQFGYQIDCDTPVFDASFAVAAEQGVIDAATGVGATGASRVKVAIATAGMTAGVHTVNVLYKNAEGTVAMLSTFKVLVTDETGANATAYYSAEELVAMGATNATVTSTDGYAHVVTTDAVGGKNDPKFTFTSNGFSDIVVIKYKTNSPGYGSNYDGYFLLNGNQFIGNRSKSDNWYEYYGDGEWHYLVLNLRKNKASSSAAANTDVVDGASLTTVEFVPFDYAGNKSGKNLADEYIDIAYVAFY